MSQLENPPKKNDRRFKPPGSLIPRMRWSGVQGRVDSKKGLVKQSHPVRKKVSQGRSNQFPKCPQAIFLQRQESCQRLQ